MNLRSMYEGMPVTITLADDGQAAQGSLQRVWRRYGSQHRERFERCQLPNALEGLGKAGKQGHGSWRLGGGAWGVYAEGKPTLA